MSDMPELQSTTIQRLQDSVVPAFALLAGHAARPLHPARRRRADARRPGGPARRRCQPPVPPALRPRRHRPSHRAGRALPQQPRSRRIPRRRTPPLPRRLARDPRLDLGGQPAHRRVDPHRRPRRRARLVPGRPAERRRPPRSGLPGARLRPRPRRAPRPRRRSARSSTSAAARARCCSASCSAGRTSAAPSSNSPR